jgi:hypothetical protein
VLERKARRRGGHSDEFEMGEGGDDDWVEICRRVWMKKCRKTEGKLRSWRNESSNVSHRPRIQGPRVEGELGDRSRAALPAATVISGQINYDWNWL